MTTTARPIPSDLLQHPVLDNHPRVKDLYSTHGGIPANAEDEDLESVLAFTNEVAQHAVQPGTTNRTDPSPRRTARVFRSEILGHREPSVSPDRASTISSNSNDVDPAPQRQRYRSRSRPPTTCTVKEEPEEPRTPGKRDFPSSTSDLMALEHRVSTMVQQLHEFHDRLLNAVGGVEKKLDVAEARNSNKVNSYLGRPLVPVSNGRHPVPRDLTPLTSLDVIHTMPLEQVDQWLEYYTGSRPPAGDERGARQALRACTGVDVQVM